MTLTEEWARHYTEYRDSPSPSTQDAFWQIGARDMRLFDLSQVPPAARREVGFETFLLLWEVIARVELPDFTEDYRKQITGTLDYPPEGSSEADRG